MCTCVFGDVCGMQCSKQVSNLFSQYCRNNLLYPPLQLSVITMTTIINYQKNCIFCKILNKEEPAENIYETEDLACIKDIKPASTYHYLIIPKNHIANAKVLKKENEELFDKMVATVDIISDKLGLDKKSTRTGFHWPPFTTVSHLHLHVINPVEKMGFIQNMMFRPNSLWFVSIDYVKSRFKEMS